MASRLADEFNLAVEAWQDGAVDGWSDLQDGDWGYTLASSCFPTTGRVDLIRFSAAEDLGAEASEADTFASYERLQFADTNPSVVGGESGRGCLMDFSIASPDANTVR